jgi:hypothetical protein
VVVLGNDEDEGVGALHLRGEARVLDVVPGAVDGKGELLDVDELGLDAARFSSSPTANRATWALIRPLRVVPRITGTLSGFSSIDIVLLLLGRNVDEDVDRVRRGGRMGHHPLMLPLSKGGLQLQSPTRARRDWKRG